MESAKLTTVTYVSHTDKMQIRAGYLLHTVQDYSKKHFICKIYTITSNAVPIDPDHYSSNISIDDAEKQALEAIDSQPLLINTTKVIGSK